ncbi:protein rolling stone-like [Phthorimaea operculella]|nr:protein rolling stone-like [Phthorimaea operculella]
MGKYIRKQFQARQFLLEHHSYSDFYLSCWQTNRSPFPLLCFRAVIFLGCLAIVLASFILTAMMMNVGYWFIFMTHWGLVANLAASGFAVLVSLKAYTGKPIESYQSLPWHVKAFWVSYNIAMVIAFLVTIIYFTILLPLYADVEGVDLAVDPILDLFIHGINSVLMFFLLMTSRMPGRILHFTYPLCFGIIYLLFSVVYFFAGGTDPFGNNFIYPILNWEDPAVTGVVVVVIAVFLIILHELVVLMTACRNWLARRCGGRRSSSLDIPYS